MYRKLICFVAAGLMLAIASGVQAQPVDGQVLVLYWYGGGVDNNLDNLKGNARFPDSPDEAAWLTALDVPDRAGVDYFGARLQAILTPPADGDYTFWTASDDDSEVWLSADTDPANATLICAVEGWTAYQNWTGGGQAPGDPDRRQSDPVTLVAGQQYYVEVLFSDGTGGGHVSVAWAGPGIGDEPTVISGEYLAADEAWIPVSVYQAKEPKPADGELDVIMPLLEWTPGPGAVLHMVYFGDSPETLAMMMPTGAPLYFHPLPLTPGATYYWRIDETTDAGAVYEGKVWSFTVMPLEASRPSPADGAVYLPLEVELSWAAGQGVQQHAVYFGADEALVAAGDPNVLVATGEETTYTASELALDTTYYWRVDELGGIAGDVAGPVWNFSTFKAVESPVVEPNLVALWTFDTEPENSLVALDMTGNGHNGMVHGDIKFADAHYMGPVLKLPGGSNQFVDCGSVGISGNDPTTIACWAKADNTNIPDWTLIFGFTGTADGQGGNGSHFNIGSLGGPGGVGAHCWGWEETIFSDQEALEWHHYAMTYDGTTIAYYGDGVQVDTDEAKSNVQDLAIRGDRVHIGSRITQASSFPGMVDDCRIYDRVLTADEIAELAVGPIITKVVRAGGVSGNRDLIGEYGPDTEPMPMPAGGLMDGNPVFSDRTYPWAGIPAEYVGAEYIPTFNSDKNGGTVDVTYTVTISRPAIVWITCDDRIPAEWDSDGTIASQQDAVDRVCVTTPDGTFVDTGIDIFVREKDDGSRDRPMSVFAAELDAGTYVFNSMDSGKNFYTIGAVPLQ